jgi:large subunit ribosomal protein L13
MKSFQPKMPSSNQRAWVVVDVDGKSLGRVATTIANLLRGKNKVDFTPHIDNGLFVVAINAAKVRLTGKKEEKKFYAFYSGYRSGLKEIQAQVMRERHPDRLIRLAVRGMLPKSRQGRKIFRRLKVYAGAEHPHVAQKPGAIQVK